MHRIRAKYVLGTGKGRLLDPQNDEVVSRIFPYRSRTANKTEIDLDMIYAAQEQNSDPNEAPEDDAYIDELESFNDDDDQDFD
jgi:hypothetical protein